MPAIYKTTVYSFAFQVFVTLEAEGNRILKGTAFFSTGNTIKQSKILALAWRQATLGSIDDQATKKPLKFPLMMHQAPNAESPGDLVISLYAFAQLQAADGNLLMVEKSSARTFHYFI